MSKLEGMTCSNCGKPAKIIRGNYEFPESGLSHVVLCGIELAHCDHCGNEDPLIPAMNSLFRTLALAVANKPYRLAGEEVRFLRKYLQLTQDKFSRLLHIDKTTLSKWENDDDPVGTQSDLAIRMLVLAKDEQLQPKLAELVNEQFEKIQFVEQRRGKKYRPAEAKIEVNAADLSFCYV